MYSTNKSATLITDSLDFIFESEEIAILIENAERQIEFVNPLFCSLFQIKLPPQKLIGTNVLDTVSVFSLNFEKSSRFEKSITQIPQQAELIKNEIWKLRNGKIVERDYIPIFKKNDLNGHIWIYKVQKLSTHSVYKENNSLSFENALHSIPGEIAIFNLKGQIVFANKAYISSHEKRVWAQGKTLTQYFSYANLSTDTAKNRVENISKVIETKKSIVWEEISITPAKQTKFLLRTCHPVFDEKENIETVIEQSIDISDQKQLEFKLKKSTDQFFNTINSINDIVIHTDDELKLKFVNKAWEELVGNLTEQYKSKPIFDLLSIKRYELYTKIFNILSGKADTHTGLVNIFGKDGKEKILKYNLQRSFNVDDDKQGILATLTDITNQKSQETQLLELVKKEKELNELKTAFVNMVSHELRTPLTVISSSAEILELMLQTGKGYEDVCIYTKQIIDEVEKMTSFMQDLLMVSKIEAGKIVVQTALVDIVAFVKRTISNGFNPWKDGRIVDFSIKREPKKAAIDQKMLEHALQNLLQNAFKYSAGKSNPKLRIAFSNTYFTISVVDDGIGIPQKEVIELFSSFFRASNTANISGTGIGLVVTKYFTEQHKGYAAVKSILNKGSIFTLKLPYKS